MTRKVPEIRSDAVGKRVSQCVLLIGICVAYVALVVLLGRLALFLGFTEFLSAGALLCVMLPPIYVYFRLVPPKRMRTYHIYDEYGNRLRFILDTTAPQEEQDAVRLKKIAEIQSISR